MNRNTYVRRALALVAITTIGLIAGQSFAASNSGALTGTVNVNTATADELQLLPGIGESRAQAVIAIRKRRGGFKSVDDLAEVKGIGEAALVKIRPFARVDGKTTARRE